MLLGARRHTCTLTVASDQPYCQSARVNRNQLVQHYPEHRIARADSWKIWEIFHGTYAFWSVHAIVQHWTQNKPNSYNGNALIDCSSFAVLLRLYRRGSNRGISICLGIDRYSRRQSCFLSYPSIIVRSADVFQYVQAGNVAAVRSTFQMGKASPGDLTLDGTGLLHVNPNFHFGP